MKMVKYVSHDVEPSTGRKLNFACNIVMLRGSPMTIFGGKRPHRECFKQVGIAVLL